MTDKHQVVICDYVIEELRLVTGHRFSAKKHSLEQFFLELPYELVYAPREFLERY